MSRKKIRAVLVELVLDSMDIPVMIKTAVRNLGEKQIDAFAEHDAAVGRTDINFPEIDVAETAPGRQPARNMPFGTQREEIDREV